MARSLERIIREVVIADPALGTVRILKSDVSDGFYHTGLLHTYNTKLGIVFPSEGEDKELAAVLLTIPMGWEKSPPIFRTDTDTVADLANTALCCNTPALMHRLDEMAEYIVRKAPLALQAALSELMRDPQLRRANGKPAACVEVLSTIS